MSSDFNDPARTSGHKPVPTPCEINLGRFAPADNIYDAIRADVKALGGVDFEPLPRK